MAAEGAAADSWGSWGQGWGNASWSGSGNWWDGYAGGSSWGGSDWGKTPPVTPRSPETKLAQTTPAAAPELTAEAGLAEERRRRTEAESALADERKRREAAESEVDSLKRRIQDLQRQLDDARSQRTAEKAEAASEPAPAWDQPTPAAQEVTPAAPEDTTVLEEPKSNQDEQRHPHENEEWYQKWLRRQKNKPRQIIELGADHHQEPEAPRAEEAAQEGGGESSAAPAEEQQGQKGYENEEWYQKWLRRQKNKGRQIIEIGVDRSQEEAKAQEAEDPSAERRLDPDDKKIYTFKQLSAKYKGHFPDDEIKAYWDSDCKVPEDGDAGQEAEKSEVTDQKGEGEEAKPAEPEKKGYEQEEWYQKWLRRQANKNRQIIEIG